MPQVKLPFEIKSPHLQWYLLKERPQDFNSTMLLFHTFILFYFICYLIAVVKVRIQAALAAHGNDAIYKTPRQSLLKIVAEEGLFRSWGGLWLPGLAPSVLREMSYSSLRFSLYSPVKALFISADNADPGLVPKIMSGGVAGSIGASIATQADVVKIRFQKEAGLVGPSGLYTTGLHAGQPPTYPTTHAAFAAIYREGGLRALWVGWQPTVCRAGFLAAAQLSTYDHTKHVMKNQGWMSEGVPLHVTASLAAAVNAAIVTQPFDTVRIFFFSNNCFFFFRGDSFLACQQLHTKLNLHIIVLNRLSFFFQVRTLLMTGNYQGGFASGVRQIIGAHGFGYLYRGFFPSLCRFGPQFTVALPLWEQLRLLLGLRPV